jgi:superfamily I DNA/RNA helicase
VGSASKKVSRKYQELLGADRSEFDLLLHLPVSDVERIGGELLAEGVRRMRARKVYISEGYDGEYGTVRVFRDKELQQARIHTTGQKGLFSPDAETAAAAAAEKAPGAGSGLSPPAPRPLISFDMAAFKRYRHEDALRPSRAGSTSVTPAQGELFSETVRPTEGLNGAQLSASGHIDGPALVLSGPGTGKTRTLTRRIARLITEHRISPGRVLAVTFTNKAAREMEERLSILLPQDVCRELSILTFHRLGLTLLRENSEAAGLSEGFTILEEDEKRHLLSTIIRQSGGAEKNRPAGHSKDKHPAVELSRVITRIKQEVRRAEDIEDERARKLFSAYEKALREYNLLDLDDLLYRTVVLLRDHRDVLETLRNRFPYVSIDEYQDINGAQYALIMLLCPPPNANIFAIGDPNQAIYGFRGADVSFINRFFADYPDAVRYSLDVSYRCSDTLLAAAGQVVDGEKQKSRQNLKGLEEGVKIEIVEISSDKSEAEFIARRIEEMIGGARFFSMDSEVSSGDAGDGGAGSDRGATSLADIAVLCRTSRQMSAVETAFGHHAIPFKTVEAKPPFEDGPAGTVLKVIKAAANPKNHLLQKILERDNPAAAAAVSQVSTLIGKGAGPVSEMVRKVVSLLAEAGDNTISADGPHITELLDYAGRFGPDLEGFLRSVSLGSEVDIRMGQDREVQRVSIMTLHAAKGLEFDTVFIPGCEDGLIPYALFENQTADPQEERRLLYVGMTRAKRQVVLSYAGRRSLFGNIYRLKPSRFISDIEEELRDRRKLEHRKQAKPDDRQLPLF